MEELLRFIFGELDNQGINYMLSGSMALNSYTVPRFTRDTGLSCKNGKEHLALPLWLLRLQNHDHKLLSS